MKLKAKEIVDLFYEDKHFIALHSPLDTLDLINNIYHYLALEFKKIEETVFIEKPDLESEGQGLFGGLAVPKVATEFYAFECINPIDQCQYTLYENIKDARPLIKSLPNVDYIWMLESINDAEKYSMDMISKINTLPSVQVSRQLDKKEIKDKNRLIL